MKTHAPIAALAASLAATGIGATVDELRCTDDSPLFTSLWQVGALLIVVGNGQLCASLLRWYAARGVQIIAIPPFTCSVWPVT